MKEKYNSDLNWIERLFGVLRVNRDSFDTKWGYFSPRFGFTLMLDRGGYFDQRYSITICLIWGVFNIKLPFKTRIPESCDTPRYGFTLHETTMMFYFGGKMNDWDQCDTVLVCWYLPFFSWEFDFHQVKDSQGNWVKYEYDSKAINTEVHDYTYVLSSGEKQERKATCYVERRQWHRKWIPFLKMTKPCIDISFDGEVGERSGSWKGGTIGCGWDLLPDESIEQCLRRMEKERKFN